MMKNSTLDQDQIIINNPIRLNEERASRAIIWMYIMAAILIVGVFVTLLDTIVTNKYLDGEINDADSLYLLSITLTTAYGFGYIVLQILAAVFFIQWFRRSYYNLEVIGKSILESSNGMASGGWFVPFLNWVKPFSIMKEIWKENNALIQNYGLQSDELSYEGSNVNDAPLGFWWFLWIVGSISSNIAGQIYMRSEDIELILFANYIDMGSSVLLVGAAFLAAIIIKKLKVKQKLVYDNYASILSSNDNSTDNRRLY